MMYEGTRDFVRAFIRMCFDPEETVKAEVKRKALPRYLPAFEKVSKTCMSFSLRQIQGKHFGVGLDA